MAEVVVIDERSVEIIDVCAVYAFGGAGVGAFILDVTAAGVVGDKAYETRALLTCSTDTSSIRVWVGCEGDATTYSPTATVEGVAVALTESATKRWFTGYADIVLPTTGPNTVTVAASTGATRSAVITRLEGGPQITSVVFGAYPGAQTALKAGDVIGVTINAEPTATEVSISASGVASGGPFAVVAGVATGTLVIGGHDGVSNFTVSARNAFGTYGEAFVTPTLLLSQTYPSFGAFSVTYPAGQGALNTAESATVSLPVFGADTVSYVATGLDVAPGYAATKSATNTTTGYVGSGTNYTVLANRAANNASASASGLVKIATIAATAGIVAPTRLSSSPLGVAHEIRIYPTQLLAGAPSLSASIGAWQGSWTAVGAYWSRSLLITDADPKGTGTFSALTMTGLSGIPGSTITSGANYTVGGISTRTLVFAPFSRVAALGCAVGDQTKTSAFIVGGNVLTRYLNAAVVANGYYIANADGSFNANGAYLGLSDASLAGANTSGTLQVTFTETA